MTKLEEIARIIEKHMLGSGPGVAWQPHGAARAVIQALMNPTEEMLQAAHNRGGILLPRELQYTPPDYYGYKTDLQAMLQTILNEK